MKLFSPGPPVPPPGGRPSCTCFQRGLPRLHAEVQDTACAAWGIVNQNIDAAAERGATVLAPLAGLDGAQRQQRLRAAVR